MLKNTRLQIDACATFLIAALAFALSYSKLVELAERAGYSATMSHAWPIIVDGLAVVATGGVMRLQKSRWYAWALLGASTAVSVVAAVAQNVFPAGPLPPVAAAAVSVVPPLCLLVAPHLAVKLMRESQSHREGAGQGEVAQVAVSSTPDGESATELRPTATSVDVASESRQSNDAPVAAAEPATAIATVETRVRTAPRKVTSTTELAAKRTRALHLLATTDMSQRAVAAEVGVTETSVRRWIKKAEEQKDEDPSLYDAM